MCAHVQWRVCSFTRGRCSRDTLEPGPTLLPCGVPFSMTATDCLGKHTMAYLLKSTHQFAGRPCSGHAPISCRARWSPHQCAVDSEQAVWLGDVGQCLFQWLPFFSVHSSKLPRQKHHRRIPEHCELSACHHSRPQFVKGKLTSAPKLTASVEPQEPYWPKKHWPIFFLCLSRGKDVTLRPSRQ